MNRFTRDLKSYLGTLKNGNYLPCYVLCDRPFILVAYFFDFVRDIQKFKKALPRDQSVTVLFQLGYHVETDARLEEIKAGMAAITESGLSPASIFLANTESEAAKLKNAGFHARFCHQNAFLDESRYGVMSKAKKAFDAVYLARFTPCKRQELACDIPRLKLVGSFLEHERDYYEMARKKTSHAQFQEKIYARNVYKHLNEAHVGLCLSDIEGAMFVSAEYLLCGLGVVTTENLGGRERLFPKFAYRLTEADPTAVNAAVQAIKKLELKPDNVRKATISLMHEHRKTLIQIVQEVIDRHEMNFDFSQRWPQVFTHKLGLRTAVPRARKKLNGLKPLRE